ncbi:MAG: HAD family hydrolase [Anaerolineae bacterium]|nr:HAD family hydrolase [Anaerolineae bacterium]
MQYKGIIFDFDGTIFDSEVPEYEAWVEIFRRYDAILPITAWAACVGSSNDKFDVIAYLENQCNIRVDAGTLYQLQRQLSDERVAQSKPLPGVIEIIQQAKEHKLRLAIASSSPQNWVHTQLRRLGLVQEFEIICTADDVRNVKPDPELFLCATKKMGLKPGEVIAFEDSPNGITAALSAGMVCIAIPNEITRYLDTSHATHTFNSMAEIQLNDLFVRLNSGSKKK